MNVPDPAILPAEGEVRVFRISGRMVCLGRYNARLHAVSNKCPHAGGSLGNGDLDENGNVVCPLHRYKFDMQTGKPMGEPTGAVAVYPVVVEDDEIRIGFPKKRSWLG